MQQAVLPWGRGGCRYRRGVSFGVGEREGATLGAAGGLAVGKPSAGGLRQAKQNLQEQQRVWGQKMEAERRSARRTIGWGGSGGPLEGPADGGNAPLGCSI